MIPESKRNMLTLARKALENELLHAAYDLRLLKSPDLEEKRGLFVTLYHKGNLRGCIGRLEANNTIYKNIIELSKAAAFEDHRFKTLTAKELPAVRIEISLLGTPKKVQGATTSEKIMKLRPHQDGVILSNGHHSATFLPQVWDAVPNREDFIGDLCRKAGLPADYWENNQLDLSTYQVEHFEEE